MTEITIFLFQCLFSPKAETKTAVTQSPQKSSDRIYPQLPLNHHIISKIFDAERHMIFSAALFIIHPKATHQPFQIALALVPDLPWVDEPSHR